MSHLKRMRKPIAVVLGIAVGAWMLSTLLVLLERTGESGVERAELFETTDLLAERDEAFRELVEEERTKRRLLQEQVEGLGEEPVVDEGPTPVLPGRPPSFPQVVAAVDEAITAALFEVCDGDCAGEPGTDGADSTVPGPAGSDSTVPGPAGSDSTVPGPRGPEGPAGRDGRGIVGLANCEGGLTEFFSFDVVYSDGTTETVSCGMLPPLEPTPEPVPEPTG